MRSAILAGLRRDAALVRAYEELKLTLAQRYSADRIAYSAAKDKFVAATLARR